MLIPVEDFHWDAMREKNERLTTLLDQSAMTIADLKQLLQTETSEGARLKSNLKIQSEWAVRYRDALVGYIDACPMCSSGVECQDELCFAYRDLVSEGRAPDEKGLDQNGN